MIGAVCRQERQAMRDLIPIVFFDGTRERVDSEQPPYVTTPPAPVIWNHQAFLCVEQLKGRDHRSPINAVGINLREHITRRQPSQRPLYFIHF